MDEIEVPKVRTFIPLFMLLIERTDGKIEVVTGKNEKSPIVAIGSNQYLLREIGDNLLEKNLIIGYQLVKTLTWPVRK